jgi:UDP-3-O-[3-hydroxymyristoyl] N-acetylglucosamine deacetylase
MRLQATIGREIVLEGVGLHSGEPTRVTIQPAPSNTGIHFLSYADEGGGSVLAHYSNLVKANNAITIGKDTFSIQTIEHFMAVLYAFGISNAYLTVEGEEMPILDGSSQYIVEAVQKAGTQPQGALQEVFHIPFPIWVEENGSYLIALPAQDFRITYTIDFQLKSSAVGTQTAHYVIDRETFVESIAPARTFGFYEELEHLKLNNLARGGSLDNALVFTRDGLMNDELRFTNECVRHKMLDLIGDLALIGCPLVGHFIAHKAGHAVDLALARKIDVVRRRKQRSRVITRELRRRREFEFSKFKEKINLAP